MRISETHIVTSTVLLFVALSTGLATANASSDGDCKDAWTSSSASNSCGTSNGVAEFGYSVDTSQYTVGVYDGECRVQVECMLGDSYTAPKANDFVGSTDDVESLYNCNGDLSVSSC